MSLGSWDPQNAQESSEFQIDPQQLQQFITIANDERLDLLASVLSSQQQQQQAPLMQLPASDWLAASAELDNDQLLALIRFFTRAEQLPGWQAGDKSPVIALSKVLKQRGEKLDRELLLWIRSNSDNRFLPYGSL